MMELDITFGEDFDALEKLCADGRVSAAQLLALTEDRTEEAVEDLLQYMEDRGWELDISGLHITTGADQLSLRLRTEEELVQSGDLLKGLEESDPLRLYLEELAQIPAAGDPDVLAKELSEGKQVWDRLMNLMLSRVVEKAKEHTGRGVLLLDLIQEGSLGLWKGILAYKEGSIEPFCDRWICRYMAKAVFMQARAAGLGQKLREGLRDYVDVDQQLLTELGRNPTTEEIAEQMHITATEVLTYEAMLQSAKSRSRVEAERSLQEATEEDNQPVENTAYFQMRQTVAELMSGLSQQEAKLLSLRYGLEGGVPLNPQQTGIKLGMTAKEVISMEDAILKKLRN